MAKKNIKKMLASTLPPLNADQAAALLKVKGGADVYDYGLAAQLRALSRTHSSLLIITKPMAFTGTGAERVPYFGCILSEEGVGALIAFLQARE